MTDDDQELTHPGEILLENFLEPMSISQRDLAKAIHITEQQVDNIITGECGIPPGIALRLSRYFNLSEDYWIKIQSRYDFEYAKYSEAWVLKHIIPYSKDYDPVSILLNKIKNLDNSFKEEGALNARKKVLIRQLELKFGTTENDRNRIHNIDSSWVLDVALKNVVRDIDKQELMSHVL